jgi:hypothetical protein
MLSALAAISLDSASILGHENEILRYALDDDWGNALLLSECGCQAQLCHAEHSMTMCDNASCHWIVVEPYKENT